METILKTPNWQKIMSELYCNGGKFNITQLIPRLNFSSPSTFYTITNLEKIGLIIKKEVKKDKRKKLLALTDESRDIAKCCYNLLMAKQALINKEKEKDKQLSIESTRFG